MDDQNRRGGVNRLAGRRDNSNRMSRGWWRSLNREALHLLPIIFFGQNAGVAINQKPVCLEKRKTHNQSRAFPVEYIGPHVHANPLHLNRKVNLSPDRFNLPVTISDLLVARLEGVHQAKLFKQGRLDERGGSTGVDQGQKIHTANRHLHV